MIGKGVDGMSNKFIFNEDINKIITKRKSVRTYITERYQMKY